MSLTPYLGTPPVSPGLRRSAPVSPGLRRMSSKNRDLIDRLQTSASWTTMEEMSYQTGQMSCLSSRHLSCLSSRHLSCLNLY